MLRYPLALCVSYSSHPSIGPPRVSQSTVNPPSDRPHRLLHPRSSILPLTTPVLGGPFPARPRHSGYSVSLIDMQRVPLASRPATGLPYGKRSCKAFYGVPPDVSLGDPPRRFRILLPQRGPPPMENILAPANLVRPTCLLYCLASSCPSLTCLSQASGSPCQWLPATPYPPRHIARHGVDTHHLPPSP